MSASQPLPERAMGWLRTSYPYAVVRRFFDLELLDRSFGLAAQAFVAMLPLLIIFVSLLIGAPEKVISASVSDRFGLDSYARTAIQVLFQAPVSIKTISWLAVVMSLLSAFSLSKRLSRVYASIVHQPPLQRTQFWRGLVWIVLQVTMYVLASDLRAVRRDSGPGIAALAVVALLIAWFLADVAGLRLLVPTVPRRILVPSALLAAMGRVGLTAWAAVYMPKALSDQAAQYGPIGVTFAFFTFLLASVLVYVCAPLLAAVWQDWRADGAALDAEAT
jgi:membrane protein